jgi:hypothetical protein
MVNPTVPPQATFPVSPILARMPIGFMDPNLEGQVLPTLQFLKMYQQLWAAIQGQGGVIDIVDFLVSLATAPPFEYSSPEQEALYARFAALQVPADPSVPGYSPYAPSDPGAVDQYQPFQPNDPAPQFSAYSPTITFDTPGDLSVAYTEQQGKFQLIGNLVCFNLRVKFTPTFTTASGAIRISAPATNGPDINNVPVPADPGIVNWGAGYTDIMGNMAASTNYFTLNARQSAGSPVSLTTTNYVTGVLYTILVSGCYFKS